MKYKKLTKEQILISIDRLTRFKTTGLKYRRVFSDIILSCMTEPKYSKTALEGMASGELTAIASEILNSSILELTDNNEKAAEGAYINNIIKEHENNVYFNDKEAQTFLNNNILYIHAINLIPDDCPVNLKWLKSLKDINNNDGNKLINNRQDDQLKYPLEKIILAEGITEEILLPAFSRYLGHDFYKDGVQIIAAGGKNQVVKAYYRLINEVRLPIYILLDKDAEENISQIKPKLRNIDKIHLVSCGEFEDLLPESLIIKAVNSRYGNFFSISADDLKVNMPTAKVLEELFRTKGLYEFKKADFAKLVKEHINDDSDISDEIRGIIQELNN